MNRYDVKEQLFVTARDTIANAGHFRHMVVGAREADELPVISVMVRDFTDDKAAAFVEAFSCVGFFRPDFIAFLGDAYRLKIPPGENWDGTPPQENPNSVDVLLYLDRSREGEEHMDAQEYGRDDDGTVVFKEMSGEDEEKPDPNGLVETLMRGTFEMDERAVLGKLQQLGGTLDDVCRYYASLGHLPMVLKGEVDG